MHNDEIYNLIDGTVHMLKDMTFDYGIPGYVKVTMQKKIQVLEEAMEKLEEGL